MCGICLNFDSATKTEAADKVPQLQKIEHNLTEAELYTGHAFLKKYPTIDIHAHPGRFFMVGPHAGSALDKHYTPPFPDQAISDMAMGGISAVMFATVADHALLGISKTGMGAQRSFNPGEALEDHNRQISVLQSLVQNSKLQHATNKHDIKLGHSNGAVSCIFSVEGGDFIEDQLDRITEAHCNGVRSITIIHYNINQIGDTQTETPFHNGLTKLGQNIIREMDRVGILVDLAHASFEASIAAAEVSSKPMMISHSNIAQSNDTHPRLISLEHAKLVTETGGIIGAVPAGFGQKNFTDYIDTIIRMSDLLGTDHVVIGTDMDFTYKPVFTSYHDWALIPAALLARGMHEHEVADIMGRNFLRILPD
ncbi:dipeptidase [Kordiimonas pumila]|uniref:Dipeptidase n=1 Tax=Kordiimonas pumila TaxID=2161677 RepID=A0ABV7D7F0_9PROT|nr:membrane dipeptidase [Kordiimonas pumila]